MALATTLDAFVHAAHLLATVSTCFADRRAGFAVVRMKLAVAAHEIDTRRTGCGAVEHQLDVGLLDVGTTFGETSRGQHLVERCLTFLAVLDTVFHRYCRGIHRVFLY